MLLESERCCRAYFQQRCCRALCQQYRYAARGGIFGPGGRTATCLARHARRTDSSEACCCAIRDPASQQSRSGAPEHAASERGTAIAKAATDHGMAVQTQTASSNLKWEHRKKYPERYPEGCYDKDWINNRWRNPQRSRTEITHRDHAQWDKHRDHAQRSHTQAHTYKQSPRLSSPGPRAWAPNATHRLPPHLVIYTYVHI